MSRQKDFLSSKICRTGSHTYDLLPFRSYSYLLKRLLCKSCLKDSHVKAADKTPL
jgi:hypothetical protein